MPATPQQQALLAGFAARLEGCAHGEGGAVIAEAAAALGVSVQTVHRWLKPHRASTRKPRCDKGRTALAEAEARLIAATLHEGARQNDKENVALTDAVDWLRSGGHIRAERTAADTGEIKPLSDSAIARALKQYVLHPGQIKVPRPYQPLSTPHPNHTWQVDASVCVVFYLPAGGVGLCELDDAEHYKNKPENLKAIEAFRVIRYVGTDHNSGVVRVRYYPHAETGGHTVQFLAWMMAPKTAANDPFHGAPKQVMVDPGATAAGLVKRFCHRLGITLIVNKPRNPRAKGQVEQANNLWETKFEGGLRFQRHRVQSFADLNALADTFQLYLNARKVHSRHGKTRFAQWLTIRADELRVTAPESALLALATEAPTLCTVRGDLTVRFRKRVFRVHTVPGALVKGKVAVHWHPFMAETAMAVVTGADGQELHIPLEEVTRREDGFPSHAAEVGSEFKSIPDTAAVANAKALERLASGEATQAAADAARRAKGYQPLKHLGPDGLNPYHAAETAPVVPFLPRAGTPLAATEAPVMVARTLTATRAALVLRERLGAAWRPEFFEFLQRRFAEGIAEDQLERLAAQWGGEEGRDAAAG